MREKDFHQFIIDTNILKEKISEWKDHFPRVQPFYAVKCNDHFEILRTLGEHQVNFDCASKNEINKILSLGVNPSRILFAHPSKSINDLRFAFERGISTMTFDSIEELQKIRNVMNEYSNLNINLILRISTNDKDALCRLSSKFGATINQAREILERSIQYNIPIIGVSFHVGSGNKNPIEAFKNAIIDAREVFNINSQLNLPPMKILDIGGGFSGNYSNEKAPLGIESVLKTDLYNISNEINKELNTYFPIIEDVNIIAEPGRFFVSKCCKLYVSVVGKKVCKDFCNGIDKYIYYLNDGVYTTFNNVIYDHYIPTPKVFKKTFKEGRENNIELKSTTLFGPTCDSIDCVCKDILFEDLEVGDVLVFEDMGAYTIVAGSEFNGFEKPEIIVI